jgi:hypothetical protein
LILAVLDPSLCGWSVTKQATEDTKRTNGYEV